MNAKRFFLAAVLASAALLCGAAGLVAWVDPLLASGVEEGGTALFINERYEMAGLLRHQEYSNLVMGTSTTANFRASWFTDWLGSKTLKVSFPDGRLAEFDIALDLACRTHGPMERVFFGLDPSVLARADQSVELPEYLYNDNPLDDFQFYLSAESVALAGKSLLDQDEQVTLDEAYTWDRDRVFSTAVAIESYPRPEFLSAPLPADSYLAAAQDNMDIICSWVEKYPETQFTIWFPPNSVLFWDQAERQGRTEAYLTAIEYACGRLFAYDNVAVLSYLNSQIITTNLENYTDHIHFSGGAAAWLSRQMLAGDWKFWIDTYEAQINELREFVTSYDYDAIFERRPGEA